MEVKLDKRELLLEKMRIFREMLVVAEVHDPGLWRLLETLNPLFEEIEDGCIDPPYKGGYTIPFQGDGVTYEYPHPLFLASAEFNAALFDWYSWPSYRAAAKNAERKV